MGGWLRDLKPKHFRVKNCRVFLFISGAVETKSQATFLFSTPLRSEVVNKEERIVTPQFLSVSKIIPNKFANARPSPTALRFRWSNKQPSGDIGPNPPNHLPELSSFPSSFKIKNKCFRLSSPLLAFLRPRSTSPWTSGFFTRRLKCLENRVTFKTV